MFRRPTRKEWTEMLVLTILAVALRVERGTGTSGRTPGFMYQRFAELKDGGVHSKPDMWNDAFRTQTAQNVNVAVNGISKLMRMMVEEDD
jgi:hypothetical protein